MKIFILFIIPNILTTDTNTDGYFYIGFDKGTLSLKIKSLLLNSMNKFLERLELVKYSLDNQTLNNINKFSYSGNIEIEINKLLDYIFDVSEISLLPNKHLLRVINNFKECIIENHYLSFMDADLQNIKHETLYIMLNQVYEYINLLIKNQKIYSRYIFNEFSVASFMLFNEERDVGIDPSPEEIIQPIISSHEPRRSDILRDKLIIHDIKLQDFFSEDDRIIDMLEIYLRAQLQNQTSGNIFIIVDFECYIISLFIAIHKKMYNNENYLYDIVGYKKNIKRKISNAKNVNTFKKLISENPRMNVIYAHNYNHYDNWIYVLSNISANEDEWKYFIGKMNALKGKINKLNLLVTEYIMILFGQMNTNKENVIDSNTLIKMNASLNIFLIFLILLCFNQIY